MVCGNRSLQDLGNPPMVTLALAPEQRLVSGVLNQRVPKSVARLRGNALHEQQSCIRQLFSAPASLSSSIAAIAASNSQENSCPITDATCAISRASPSRSRRAISESCSVAGISRNAGLTSPPFSHRPDQLLDKQRHPAAALDHRLHRSRPAARCVSVSRATISRALRALSRFSVNCA